jgi:hypothetical protein
MRPLEPLIAAASSPHASIAKLLKGAPAVEVRREIERNAALGLRGVEAAALAFAQGALALREGALDPAHESFSRAADAFAALGEAEASALARAEMWLAAIRRGPHRVYGEAIHALAEIAEEAKGSALVLVVALHYRGTAERFAGDALATQRTLLAAFARSEGLLEERAQILNSLGTLYVIMGAFGAAQAMLEHAAELHHQNGDAVGEAIAYGQLGSAALACGELDRARSFLQKQEWFASRVGDAFGRARALVFLADLALELKRPDDTVLLATQAREVAMSVTPHLTMWVAYATRSIGRAKLELGEEGAKAELDRAAELFARIGNQLGDALTRWDLAHLEARSSGGAAGAAWFSAAWALGTLGLPARVAQLLGDQRAHALARQREGEVLRTATEEALAVAAQGTPHLGVEQELRLVYGGPEELAAIASRRVAAQRNLARLAALTIGGVGLYVAAIRSAAIGAEAGRSAIPTLRARAAAVAELPGIVVWVWPLASPIAEVARDLASARATLGEDTSAALVVAPEAVVLSPPFAGEVSARVRDARIADAIASAMREEPGSLRLESTVAWSPDAEALAKLAGYAVVR